MNFKKERKDFSNGNLKEFPIEALESRKLRKLLLRNNDIKRLPEVISKLCLLETLDLTGNKIRTLYAKIFDLQKLRILILRNNEIISIPKQIRLLQNLKILNLANNNLKTLPIEINQLQNLEELNISGNKFAEFPEEIFSLKNLKTLWIGQNLLTSFPFTRILNELPQLKKLYCYSYLLNEQDVTVDSIFTEVSRLKGSCLTHLKIINAQKIDQTEVAVSNNTKQLAQNMNKIFISYAHSDKKEWIERLQNHISALQHEGIELSVWNDNKIKPGTRWKEEINENLNQAAIAVLLVSANFLASDFIRTNELPPLLKKAEEKGTLILPVIISPCRFTKTKSIGDFQSVNDPKITLEDMSFPEQERIFMKLVEAIEEHVKR